MFVCSAGFCSTAYGICVHKQTCVYSVVLLLYSYSDLAHLRVADNNVKEEKNGMMRLS